ncbi:SOS response-associated peptidase family protein [Paracandidimonas lactea]|uniref:SOS response-associated peptidase family protein n=1 Tax=Paracandidimonas lactea TaxID=2895524 RepID=UPI001F328C54|nr:SOS response-associated peptidase family protein [Paracandidimonas lactea]
MQNCTITRTHRHGRKLPERQWDAPVPGPVQMDMYRHAVLNRYIPRLQVVRHAHGGKDTPRPIPDPLQPELLALGAHGMMDLHDRRPVALLLDDALAWLDPETPIDAAFELLSTPRPESAFQWWQVTRAMGNSRHQNPLANEPVES